MNLYHFSLWSYDLKLSNVISEYIKVVAIAIAIAHRYNCFCIYAISIDMNQPLLTAQEFAVYIDILIVKRKELIELLLRNTPLNLTNLSLKKMLSRQHKLSESL